MTFPAPTPHDIDAELRGILADSCDGLDLEAIRGALKDTAIALGKQARALAAADYGADREREIACPACRKKVTVLLPVNPTDVARAQAHSAKVLDEVYRMIQFAKGAPDSRPDTGGDWLRALSPEQLKIVQGWFEAGT